MTARRVRSGKSSVPPRVGINAVFLRPRMGGLETYVNALVPELRRLAPDVRLTIFCGPQGLQQLRDQDWSSDVSLATHPLLGRPGLKAVSELTLLGPLASRRVDLLHNVALTAPLRTRAVNVVLIADVTWIVAPDPGDRVTNTVWRIAVPPVARRADRVLALSNAGAEDIVRHLRVPRQRIDVIPPGPGVSGNVSPTPEAELRSRLGLGRRPGNPHRLREASPQEPRSPDSSDARHRSGSSGCRAGDARQSDASRTRTQTTRLRARGRRPRRIPELRRRAGSREPLPDRPLLRVRLSQRRLWVTCSGSDAPRASRRVCVRLGAAGGGWRCGRVFRPPERAGHRSRAPRADR